MVPGGRWPPGWAVGEGEAASVYLDFASLAVHALLMLLTGLVSFTPIPSSHSLSLGSRELQKDKRGRGRPTSYVQTFEPTVFPKSCLSLSL